MSNQILLNFFEWLAGNCVGPDKREYIRIQLHLPVYLL